MKIGLNATCFNNRPSGAKQRFIGLYSQLFKIMHDDEFIIFQPSDCCLKKWFNQSNVRFLSTPIPSEGRILKYLQGSIFWKSLLKTEKLDMFECFNLPSILNPSGSTIQTIHDVRSLHINSIFIEKIISHYVHDKTVKRTDKIITVSETMKFEILNFFPNANVEILYNGIDLSEFTLHDPSHQIKTRNKYKLPTNFLLSVGHFEHRKNYSNLIYALRTLKDDGYDYFLIIVGNDNGEKSRINDQIIDLDLQKNVMLLSNLTNEEVKSIYGLSSAFIFPSLYEGFGIPILETMAHNKPLILSNISVFKEITESKGVYFDPNIIQSIANSIKNVVEDTKISNELIEYGRNRVKDFDFRKLAPRLKEIYLT